MSDVYYRDREIKFVLSDRIAIGTDCDEVIRSSVKIYIGDNRFPTIECDTLLEAIKSFDHWCTFHNIGSEVENND